MIFVDFLGPAELFEDVRDVVQREVGQALRMPEDQVSVRRIVVEPADGRDLELWIELSSDEQLYRVGRRLARGITDGLQADHSDARVWVMYRVVPLSHAFLNGEPRARGAPGFE